MSQVLVVDCGKQDADALMAELRGRGYGVLSESDNEKAPALGAGQLPRAAYTFAETISHDVRTPLGVIRDFASIVRDGLAGSVTDKQQEYLDIVSNSVDDVLLMVNDMLDITKADVGLLNVRRTVGTVQQIVANVTPSLQRKADAAKVKLSIEIDAGLPDVACDVAQIGRVVINLLVHSIKRTDEGGHVSVWARADSGAMEVTFGVTDNGFALDPSKLEVIRERFGQAGTSTYATTQGVGLCLSIAKEIVARNLGAVRIEDHSGGHNTVSFTVPRAEPGALLDRYLAHSDAAGQTPRQLELWSVHLDKVSEEDALERASESLHRAVNRTDLLLAVSPGKWLLLTDADHETPDHVAAAFAPRSSLADEKNSDDASFPARFNLSGRWRMPEQRRELLAAFTDGMRQPQAAYSGS